MNILILGGTKFLGRAIATDALNRGHDATCLARGTSSPVDGVEFVRADRSDSDSLADVRPRLWDCVVDLTSHPQHAREAARELSAAHYVYVSSSSVYAEQGAVSAEGDVTVAPLNKGVMSRPEDYPAAKAACEEEYRGAAEQVMIVRPGLIGGWGDETGRSGYYPWRFAHPTGPDVIVPDGSFPVSIIDVGDLAAWIVRSAERRTSGTFNAAGTPTTLSEVVRISVELGRHRATAKILDDATLLAHGVSPWMGPESLPLWVPGSELRTIALLDATRALAAGLRLRPLATTLSEAMRYEEVRSVPRQAGLSDSKEWEIRQALNG